SHRDILAPPSWLHRVHSLPQAGGSLLRRRHHTAVERAMLHHLRSAAASASGRLPAPPEDGGDNDEESVRAIAVSDQRTIYLVNMFIANTVEFLNSFAALCDDKLALLHRKIVKLDSSLALLEAKLHSIDENNASEHPTREREHQTLTHDKIIDSANLTGESSRLPNQTSLPSKLDATNLPLQRRRRRLYLALQSAAGKLPPVASGGESVEAAGKSVAQLRRRKATLRRRPRSLSGRSIWRLAGDGFGAGESLISQRQPNKRKAPCPGLSPSEVAAEYRAAPLLPPPDLRSSSSIPCFARLLRVCTYELLVVFLHPRRLPASRPASRSAIGEAVDDQFQLRQIARMRYIYVEEEFESEQEDFEEDQDVQYCTSI
ncbi:hypothetical protein EJB05_40606, partial [Eragrostis curvula]